MSNLLFNEYHFITKKLLDAKTKIDQNNKELLSERIHNQFSELLKTSNDLAQIENRENIEIFDIKMALKSLNRNNLFLQENSFLTENISKDSLKNGEILMTSKEFEGHLSVEKPRSRCLNIHWLSIDGIEPQTVYNASNPKKLLNSKFRLNDEQKEIVLIKKKNSILTKEMERYFKEIIKNLNSDDKKIRKIAFRALSSDKGLEPLTPFFIQHVSKKISKNNDDIDSLKESLRLLSTIIFSDRAN
ncbi:histone H4-like TAF Taf6, SAGA complex subunit, partial [Bonamia ostreae]